MLANRDIYFDAAAGGQWSHVPQIKRVTVRVRVAILAVVCEFNSAAFSNGGVDRLQSAADAFKRHRREQREIQIFGKPVVAKVTALERCASLEGKALLEIAPSQCGKEPGQAVVAFEYALRNAAAARLCEAVGKQRDIALRYQFRFSGLLRVRRVIRSRGGANRKRAGLPAASPDRARRTSP